MEGKDQYLAAFGGRVKAARERAKLSQEELSERCGYEGGRATISQIERGQSDVPISKVPIIAKELNTTVTYLLSIDKEDISIERAHEDGRREATIEALEKQCEAYKEILLREADPPALSSHVVRALQELEEYEDYVLDKSLAHEPLDGSRVAYMVHKVARILKDGMQLSAVGEGVSR